MKYFNGEYKSVIDASINSERLKLAHQTPCDVATAYFLIAICHKAAGLDDKHTPLVKFRKPRAGKSRARGWGGRRAVMNEAQSFSHWRGYISLPETPCPKESVENPFGYLRVGLVLHEYAHALEILKFGDTNHGPRFTTILDKLVYDTQQYWNNPTAKLAAETK